MTSIMVNKLLKKTAILLLWIAVWQLVSMAVALEYLIPSPLSTLRALLSLMKTKEFYVAAIRSVYRILCGFALGVGIGFLCGTLSAKSRIFKDVTSPVVALTKTVPVASFIILAFYWFQSTVLPIFIAFLMVLPIIWSSTETALRSIDKKYVEMGKVFGLSPLKIFFKIKLPLIMPTFITSAITALGFAWKSGVAAEVIARPFDSLGYMLDSAKVYMDTASVFALTAMIALLSLLFEFLFKKVFGRYSYVKD